MKSEGFPTLNRRPFQKLLKGHSWTTYPFVSKYFLLTLLAPPTSTPKHYQFLVPCCSSYHDDVLLPRGILYQTPAVPAFALLSIYRTLQSLSARPERDGERLIDLTDPPAGLALPRREPGIVGECLTLHYSAGAVRMPSSV